MLLLLLSENEISERKKRRKKEKSRHLSYKLCMRYINIDCLFVSCMCVGVLVYWCVTVSVYWCIGVSSALEGGASVV